jgi:hypothetical protein
MADRLADGTRYRTLNAIDHRTRTCAGIAVERGFSSEDVTASLDRWIQQHGNFSIVYANALVSSVSPSSSQQQASGERELRRRGRHGESPGAGARCGL